MCVCTCSAGETATAVQHVLRCMGYDASDSKSISDTFLLELQPEEVQWTKVRVCARMDVCVCVCVCMHGL